MRVIREFLLVVVLVASAAGAQTGPPVRFAGPVNQDGCPFCCEFSCMLTPTPTPEFDPQGRPVFRRSIGQFLLVVEAGLGTSNRNAGSQGVFSGGSGGTVVSITDPSGKPSLMALATRNLGNGSVQDDCRTEPLGGVPAFPALDFNAGNVNTTLVETACHFELAQSTTRGNARQFNDLPPSELEHVRQYCFQVSSSTEFPIGTTTVALQSATTPATSARATSSSSSSIPTRPRRHRPPRGQRCRPRRRPERGPGR